MMIWTAIWDRHLLTTWENRVTRRTGGLRRYSLYTRRNQFKRYSDFVVLSNLILF